MNILSERDLSKYNTFFLEYYKFDSNGFDINSHLVRPSVATYEDIANNVGFTYTLDSAIMSFDNCESISKILIECAVLGINIDFIDILVPTEKDISAWNTHKIFETIDLHKDDISMYFESIDAPRYYIALNRNKSDVLKYLVIDRIKQDNNVDFLKGKYDSSAILAGFKSRRDARQMCENLNLLKGKQMT